MKITVFADVHGSVSALQTAVEICRCEKPDKTVICGDLFGGWVRRTDEIVHTLSEFDCVLYLVRGNNDRDCDVALLPLGMEDNAVMYHFGRTLFFTHGDFYNKYRIPPVLREGDALIYGHTHASLMQRYNGLTVLNVGSISIPRDGQACYMTLDEQGATLRKLDGADVMFLPWIDNKT